MGVEMSKRKKYVVLITVLIVSIILVYCLIPKSLKNIIKQGVKGWNGITYCTVYDVSGNLTSDYAGDSRQFFGLDDGQSWPLLEHVMVVGPIWYQRASGGSELVHLYFSLPQKDGSHHQLTVELIGASDGFPAFVNVGNCGYIVVSGGSEIDRFIHESMR